MNCQEYLSKARRYAEHELDAEEHARCAAHVDSCPSCGAIMAIAAEMNCKGFCDFLTEYVEGTLPEEQRRVFERHMGICPECITYLDSYRRTVAATKSLCSAPDAVPPGDVPPDLLRAILEARRAGPQGDA